MYVRWKRRASIREPDWRKQWGKRGRHGTPGNLSHYAYLVESARVDGTPRQRTVAYLGSIAEQRGHGSGEGYVRGNAADHYWFWRHVRAKLDAVEMGTAMRARCEAAIAAVVPPLVGDELAAYEAKLAAFRTAHDVKDAPQSR